MRLVGPNCLGVLNTNPGTRLNATFAPSPPPRRQRRLRHPERRARPRRDRPRRATGIGLSWFASSATAPTSRQRIARVLGERIRGPTWRCSTSSPSVIHASSQGSPSRSARQAHRRGEERPLGGRRARHRLAHRRAARGVGRGRRRALRAGRRDPHRDARGAVRRGRAAGDPAAARGRRVAIVTNAGGPGIMAADACEAAGLDVPALRTTAGAAAPSSCRRSADWSTR